MRIHNEEEREAAAQTLREVMQKLEEAWRLARELEAAAHDHDRRTEKDNSLV
jgi:hypothetical protein